MYEKVKRHQGKPPLNGIALILMGVCLISATSAFGQSANATLTGKVSDSSGLGIAGAQLTITNNDTGTKRTATADDAGRYTVADLVPGTYDVQAVKEGFSAKIFRAQTLNVDTTVTDDFALQVGSVSSSVDVSTEAPMIEPTQASVSNVVEKTEIDNLPIAARTFGSLAALTPGVTSNGAIGNAQTYQTSYTTDGISNTTGNQGNQYVQIAQDWVQEFSVQTLQFPAEFGNAGGGVINAVTRSGGNAIHGRVYGFYQDTKFNSNPSNEPSTYVKTPSQNKRFGGMLGGPIKKSKLFYFAGWEYYNSQTGATRSSSFLTAGNGTFAAAEQPSNEAINQLVPWLPAGTGVSQVQYARTTLATVKLDYDLTDKTKLVLRGNLQFSPNNNTGYGGAGPYGGQSASFADPYEMIFGLTHLISSTALTDFRAGYFQNGRGSANWSGICGVYPNNALSSEPYNYITTEAIGGVTPYGNPDGYFAGVSYPGGVSTGGGGYCGGIQNNDGSALIQDTTTWVRGNHEIKVGIEGRWGDLWSRSAQNSSTGAYTFGGTSTGATATGPFNPNTAIPQSPATTAALQPYAPTSYSVLFNGEPGLTTFSFNYLSAGFFIQDSWKIRPNLTLNLGLRYDMSNMNSSLSKENWPALEREEPGSVGFIPPGYHKINNDMLDVGPRLGIAWTPFHDGGKTVVRGGFGVFYDANDGASAGIYITSNSWATNDYAFSANTATTNPYCIGTSACTPSIPIKYQVAVADVLASALTNMTLPQFPLSSAPCAASNNCSVIVGTHVYTIPALNVNYMPSGGRVDLNQNVKVPGTAQATVGVQHQFGRQMSLSADYVHHIGFNGLIPNNTNIALTGPGATTSYTTVNPAFTQQYQLQSLGLITTNDLQMKMNYRNKRGDRITVAYQYGHSNDNSATSFAVSAHSALVSDPFNLNYDYGPSSTDIHQTLTVSGTIPIWAGKFTKKLGIDFIPLFTAASGAPYTPTSTLQKPGSANAPAGCLAYFTTCYPILPNGVQATRNSLRGTPTWNLDARLQKVVRFGNERRTLSLFLEAYNAFNHWNIGTSYYSNADTTTGSQAFGNVNLANVGLRTLQLGGKIDF